MIELLYILINILKYFLGIINYNQLIIFICNDITKSNIIFAKVLQWDLYKIFNTNNGFLKNEINEYLKKFCDNVPYSEEDIDYYILSDLIKFADNNNQKLSIENNMKPIKSGTVSLVFKGYLNNKPIVIKILRKNIHNKINNGISNLIYMVKIINFLLSLIYKSNPHIVSIIENNKQLLLEQTNFLLEIENNNRFQEISKNYDFLKIPHIYKEFLEVSNDVILMDFIEGKQLSDLYKNEITTSFKDNLIKIIIESIYIHKFLHSDIHIGNIFMLEQDKIGLIDFGLGLQIEEQEAVYISDMLFSIKNRNIQRFILSIGKLLTKDKNILQKFKTLCESKDEIMDTSFFDSLSSKKIINLLKLTYEMEFVFEPSSSKILLSMISSFSILELCNKGTPLYLIISKALGNF
jgi:predicted unusual protein kinase regulating ubiquinone biosynthesis (AarF/ABC1/UbiB family)